MFGITRRKFLFISGGTLAACAGGYWLSRKRVPLALIGAGLRGKGLAAWLEGRRWLPGYHADVVAICDVDRNHASAAAVHWPKAELYTDYRKVLERSDVRGVLIATPDHWHTLIAVHAMNAGKAVYCEKPVSLTVAEGQLLVDTARRTGCVFQGGTQQRSDKRFRTACELVRNGRLGRLRQVTITLPRRWVGESPGPFAPTNPPPELDWEQWLGQAPWVPYCPQRCHGSFRRWFEYSGGQMTDWGAHHMDIAHWAMDMDDSGPLTVEGRATFPDVPDGFNTPIDFTVDLTYPNNVHVHVRTDSQESANGIKFEGESSELFVTRGAISGPAVDELNQRPLPADAIRLTQSRKPDFLISHLYEFLSCMESGDKPPSDVVSQHRSASACHLANIAMRLKRKLTWDARSEQVVGDPEAQAMLQRPQRSPYQLSTSGTL